MCEHRDLLGDGAAPGIPGLSLLEPDVKEAIVARLTPVEVAPGGPRAGLPAGGGGRSGGWELPVNVARGCRQLVLGLGFKSGSPRGKACRTRCLARAHGVQH